MSCSWSLERGGGIQQGIRAGRKTTRLFRNGNSQAVRIPAELAYEHSDLELELELEIEIERYGDEMPIRPASHPITGH